jgi:hypothetical protein
MWWMLARMAGWDGVVTGSSEVTVNDTSPFIITEVSNEELKIITDDSFLSGSFRLYNLYGSLVSTKKITGNICLLDVSHLTPGLYFLNYTARGIGKTKKIIIP